MGGRGILSSARFIRYEYADGLFHLEAWIGKRRENALKGPPYGAHCPRRCSGKAWRNLSGSCTSRCPRPGREAGRVVTIQVPDHAKYAVPLWLFP